MERTSKIENILREIQIDVKKKYDIEISIDSLFDIVDSVIRDTAKAMKEHRTVKWDYVGKFKFNKDRKERREKINDMVKKGIKFKDRITELKILKFQQFKINKNK